LAEIAGMVLQKTAGSQWRPAAKCGFIELIRPDLPASPQPGSSRG
jgi:hypothetical protein